MKDDPELAEHAGTHECCEQRRCTNKHKQDMNLLLYVMLRECYVPRRIEHKDSMSAARIAFLEAEVEARNATIKLLDDEKHQALAELMATTTQFAEDTKARAREAVLSIRARLQQELVEQLCPAEALLHRLTAQLDGALEQLGALEEGVRAERAQWQRERAALESAVLEARRAQSPADSVEEYQKAPRRERAQGKTSARKGFPPAPRVDFPPSPRPVIVV
jgi:hypothetical protein